MSEVSIGGFFDGTNNNRFYDQTALDSNDNRRAKNAPTNVDLLFDLYSGSDKIYVTGAGTTLGWETSAERVAS